MAFSRIIMGNQSEDLDTRPYTVCTVEMEGVSRDGFGAPEYKEKVARDMVLVDGRWFAVGTSCGGKGPSWLSCTLPPELGLPTREWDVRLDEGGNIHGTHVTGTEGTVIRVREVGKGCQDGLDKPKPDTTRIVEALKKARYWMDEEDKSSMSAHDLTVYEDTMNALNFSISDISKKIVD